MQDYHFALLPRLLRERKPAATIALFWHIPWPNAETFGVCPWKQQILTHMLAADILGFQRAITARISLRRSIGSSNARSIMNT